LLVQITKSSDRGPARCRRSLRADRRRPTTTQARKQASAADNAVPSGLGTTPNAATSSPVTAISSNRSEADSDARFYRIGDGDVDIRSIANRAR
jgi:hypothetical protein